MSRSSASSSRRLVVLGAGPIGIETALNASVAGFDVTVLEAGAIGANVAQWGHIKMFSPWSMNTSSLGVDLLKKSGRPPFDDPDAFPTGRELVAQYLLPLTRTPLLAKRVVTGCRVLGVGRDGLLKGDWIGRPERALRPFRILARRDRREVIYEAEVVVDATGTFGQPRHLGNGGLPARGEKEATTRIDFQPVDLDRRAPEFLGRRVLLIGDGHSAATAAVALEELIVRDARTKVTWAVRESEGALFKRIPDDPLPERDRLMRQANAIADGTLSGIEMIPGAVVEAIAAANGGRSAARRGLRVTLVASGRRRVLQVDRILAHVGFQPDRSLYSELQVHECYASSGPMNLAAALLGSASGDCLAQPAASADVLANPEPGFFILGAKSYGRNSNFLIRTGHRQIETVLAALGPARRVA
jgi:thioredoxin reductase